MKKWSNEDRKLFLSIYEKFQDYQLADIFETNVDSIVKYKKKLGLISKDISTKEQKEDLYKIGLKRCTMCDEVLPLEDFHWANISKGIKKSRCKRCRSENRRQKKVEKKLSELINNIEAEEKLKAKKISQYKDGLAGKELFCKKCNKSKTLDDFKYRISRGRVYKSCKECEKRKSEETKLRNLLERGY